MRKPDCLICGTQKGGTRALIEQEGRSNHGVDGFIHTKQNLKTIGKETARAVLFKVGRKPKCQ